MAFDPVSPVLKARLTCSLLDSGRVVARTANIAALAGSAGSLLPGSSVEPLGVRAVPALLDRGMLAGNKSGDRRICAQGFLARRPRSSRKGMG